MMQNTMLRRTICVLLGVLLYAGVFQAFAQTAAPTTQRAPEPADQPHVKIARNGQPDPRFLQLHESFLARAKQGPIGVLFLGDSITERWNRAPDVFKAHYDKYQPANFGISGDRTEHVLWRIANGELDNIHPKVVVLMIGTNNYRYSADEIYAGVKAIVDQIHTKLPDSKLLLLAIFPRFHDPSTQPSQAAVREKLTSVNQRLAQLDDGNKTRFLDIGDKFLDANGVLQPEIMADYLHPTPKGYEIWANAMQPTLDEMMK